MKCNVSVLRVLPLYTCIKTVYRVLIVFIYIFVYVCEQTDIIPRTIRSVEASGEILEYVIELSKAFFSALTNTCKTFLDLFQTVESQQQQQQQQQQQLSGQSTASRRASVQSGKSSVAPSIQQSAATATNSPPMVQPNQEAMRIMLSMLVHWAHQQMNVFAIALSRQVRRYRNCIFYE